MKTIISAEWLSQNLGNPNLVILDASIEASADGKKFKKSDVTIPNTRRFDLKHVFLDKTSPFPNTVPKSKEFELESRKLGINRDSEIVVYDTNGVYSSPRAWWLFKSMGHHNIAVLDGGLPNWVQKGFKTSIGHLTDFKPGNFRAHYDERLNIAFEQVKENLNLKEFLIVDARAEGRFNGTAQEPRKYLKSGSILNSVNIEHKEVVRNGKFKSKEELNKLFENKCNGEQELVFSCGSGLTACIVMLANQIGYGNSLKLYDGSWTEWAELNNLKT